MSKWAVLELVFETAPTTGQLAAFNKWLSGKVQEPDGTEDTEDSETEDVDADGAAPIPTEQGWRPEITCWKSPRHTRGGENSEIIELILAGKLAELGIRCRLRVECGYASTVKYADNICRQKWTYAPPLLTPAELVRRLLDEGLTEELRSEATRLRDAMELDPRRYVVRAKVMVQEDIVL